jgi:hypothetical protein
MVCPSPALRPLCVAFPWLPHKDTAQQGAAGPLSLSKASKSRECAASELVSRLSCCLAVCQRLPDLSEREGFILNTEKHVCTRPMDMRWRCGERSTSGVLLTLAKTKDACAVSGHTLKGISCPLSGPPPGQPCALCFITSPLAYSSFVSFLERRGRLIPRG